MRRWMLMLSLVAAVSSATVIAQPPGGPGRGGPGGQGPGPGGPGGPGPGGRPGSLVIEVLDADVCHPYVGKWHVTASHVRCRLYCLKVKDEYRF